MSRDLKDDERYGIETAVMRGEDERAFDELLKAYQGIYIPRNEMELNAVHELADLEWRLRRARAIETRSLEQEMEYLQPRLDELGCERSALDDMTRAAVSQCARSGLAEQVSQQALRLSMAREKALRMLDPARKVWKYPDGGPRQDEPRLKRPDAD